MTMTAKELEARRVARAAKSKADREARDGIDREAQDGLEEQHGETNVMRIEVPTPLTLPGIVVIRRPDRSEYKNWKIAAHKTSKSMLERAQATTDLGRDCVLYPDKETLDAMIECCPGIEDKVSANAIEFAGGSQGKE